MKGYVTIRKQTLANVIAIAATAAMAICSWHKFHLEAASRDAAKVETESCNYLNAKGKNILCFSGISADSTLSGLSVGKAKYAGKTLPGTLCLHTIVNNTKDSIDREIGSLGVALAEMDYYLNVHGVQDEGYEQVAAHSDRTKARVAALRQARTQLQQIGDATPLRVVRTAKAAKAKEATPSGVFVASHGGIWKNGRWLKTKKEGKGVVRDSAGRIVSARWKDGTPYHGRTTDQTGTYRGALAPNMLADGHGKFYYNDGSYYEGHWANGQRDGFGFHLGAGKMRAGEWKGGKYKGEKLNYTSERIYGIDIARYQHGRGRRYYPIDWKRLRITGLGNMSRKTISGQVDYPVSFLYIKSTDGTTVRNPHYKADYRQARRHGIRCGAYHFFSTRSGAAAQARYFIRNTFFKPGDLPPVLDVEPSDRLIRKIGGPEELFRRIRTWMGIVEKHTGTKPILYVNQSFVNKYLDMAPDIKKDYNIWIARYGEYKPDIKLVYWQLCPDGKVAGIRGDVDINVFNGYEGRFNKFLSTQLIK